MLILETLEFNNVFSYGPETQTVILNKDTLTLLNGVNGAGKSSIPTVLEELFYNKNSRGIKKGDVKNRQAKAYFMASTFRNGNDVYRLVKNVASTAKVTLTKNGEDISGHTATQTYDMVEKIIGLEFNTFSKLVYQSMASGLDFLTATDANRKKFLVSLLGLEKYAEVQEHVKSAIYECKADLRLYTDKVDYIVNNISKIDSSKLTHKTLLIEPAISVHLHAEIAELELQLKNLKDTNLEIEKNYKAKLVWEEAKRNKPNQPPVPVTIFDYKDKLAIIGSDISRTEAELKSYEKIETECPTCKRKFEDHDEQHKTDAINTCKTKLLQLSEDKKILLVEQHVDFSWTEFYKAMERINQLEKGYDSSKPTETVSAGDILEPLNRLREQLTFETQQLEKVRKSNLESERHNSQVDLLTKQLTQLKTDLISATDSKEQAQNRLQKLEILGAAFGTKGLISYKIESSIKAFEEMINEYLSLLSEGGFALTFEVEETKLALNLLDAGQEISINSLSSGELCRVNTACLLAIRKMMTAICKVDINLLFLDEVVSVLDKEGKDTLVEVLLNEKLNSFAVSHGYHHPLASSLSVFKREGFSYVE